MKDWNSFSHRRRYGNDFFIMHYELFNKICYSLENFFDIPHGTMYLHYYNLFIKQYLSSMYNNIYVQSVYIISVSCEYQLSMKSCALICFNTSLCSTSNLCDSVLLRFIIYLLLFTQFYLSFSFYSWLVHQSLWL